jgi:mannose-1-phosphate guanylyltransferase
MDNVNYVVIMAGGVGSRFWPVSRNDYPKQFLDILGTGETLIQQTFRRFRNIVPVENIYVVTSDSYIDIVGQQLPEIPKENIVGEPLRKNTAPCIAYIAFKLLKRNSEAGMIVTPSDHLILNQQEFDAACIKGLSFVHSGNSLVTIGINPTYPATGFGYIQKEPGESASGVFKVRQFIEKPYLELARTFLKSDDFLWNAGIFIWTVKDILEAYKTHLPGMYAQFNSIKDILNSSENEMYIRHVYQQCEDISIDCGIMEKSTNVYTIPAAFEWHDLGTWSSAWANMEKDSMSNAIAGKNIMVYDSRECLVHSSSQKLIVIQGLDNYIVADTGDVLLICSRENEQEIKNYVAEIKNITGSEYLFTKK